MSASVFTVQGSRRRVSPSADCRDLEAGSITGKHALALPTAPQPARAASPPSRTPQIYTTADAIDDFFGVTRPRATRESQHDSRPSLGGDVLPQHYAEIDLPAYSAHPNTEPVTPAEYFFKLGFVCPMLWVVGTIIYVSQLSSPPDFEPTKSEREREIMQLVRDAEMRWAKRCVWGLVGLFGLAGVVIAGVAVYA